jgi:hypothetical protein
MRHAKSFVVLLLSYESERNVPEEISLFTAQKPPRMQHTTMSISAGDINCREETKI